MGHTTEFTGFVSVSPPLDADEAAYLTRFCETRRMERRCGPYHVLGTGGGGGGDDSDVLDEGRPPEGQPGLWCQWMPTEDGCGIHWDGNEKFRHPVEWMQYLIDHFLGANALAKTQTHDGVRRFTFADHVVEGAIAAQGEQPSDAWTLVVRDGKASKLSATAGDRPGLTLIVAFDDERGIGRDGALPWHHPEDLRRFRRETMGATVIVGRATLASLPGALPGRRLIVVGRTPMDGLHGAAQVPDLEAAVEMAGPGRRIVAGGATLYAAALPLADTILATRVPGSHGCDRHFPGFDEAGWFLETSEPLGDGLAFETWRRV